ncbi:hypothetical protein ACQ4M4_25300 [Leptolyngbya sp. AN02str]
MLLDLDNTLETLLRRKLPAEMLSATQTSFATPDAELISRKPATNLFL